MPGIGIVDLIESVESLLKSSGVFQTVNSHEPKHAPGPEHAAVWAQNIDPVPEISGLAATAGRVELRIRIYGNMLAEPQDDIDPDSVYKVDLVMELFSGDFDLGQRVRNVDLLGAHGQPLSAQAGYLTISGSMFRIMDITVPLIINDIWAQEA